MTFHDKRLLGQVTQKGCKKTNSKLIREGVQHVRLFHKRIAFKPGSIEGDWRSVGNEIRSAMKKATADCD